MDFDPSIAAQAKVSAAALMGGVVRMFLHPAKGLMQAAMLLLSCVIVGGFATPVVMDLWDVPADYAGAMGAALGFAGLSVAQAVLRGLDSLDLSGWLSIFQKKG